MKSFKLSRNDKCLCGSNKKFKYCCMNYIDNENYLIKTDEAIQSKKYDEAYSYCNADITKYLISMKRYTGRRIESNPKFDSEIIQDDLCGLDQIFKKLCLILFSSDINVDIDDKFSRIEKLNKNKHFFELVRYYRVFLISVDNDLEKVKALLKDLDCNNIDKEELLEYYYQFTASDFKFYKN